MTTHGGGNNERRQMKGQTPAKSSIGVLHRSVFAAGRVDIIITTLINKSSDESDVPGISGAAHGRPGNGRLLFAANGPRATYAIGRTKHLCLAMIGRIHSVAGSYSPGIVLNGRGDQQPGSRSI